jgi:hypothetical protein
MDKADALAILGSELAAFREKSYSELVAMIDQGRDTTDTVRGVERLLDRICSQPLITAGEREGAPGAVYQFEIEVFWDDKPGGDVRVMGSIANGGWRAFVPVCEDFIMSPSRAFVGE